MVEKLSQDIYIFDHNLARLRKKRCQKNFQNYDFLFRLAADRLSDRLLDINRTFDSVLQIGSRGFINHHPKFKSSIITDSIYQPTSKTHHLYIQSHEEILPFAEHSFDLIISNLHLHQINDLPGTFIQIKRALKPDGLFIASMFGGETLHELRSVFSEVEIETRNGLSPRIYPFIDKPESANLLQRAFFTLPVVDSEIITVTYNNIFKLISDLRGMGEINNIIARDTSFLGQNFFIKSAQKYAERYSENSKILATFEVIFLLGWAEHQSQQKPLKPGCASIKLADHLDTLEIKAGDLATP